MSKLGTVEKPIIVRVHSDEKAPKPAQSEKIGRNDPCKCGSGKKYKKCCGLLEA